MSCNLSGIIEERGIEKGIEKGKIKILASLVAKGLVEIENAAAELGVSVDELSEKIKKL